MNIITSIVTTCFLLLVSCGDNPVNNGGNAASSPMSVAMKIGKVAQAEIASAQMLITGDGMGQMQIALTLDGDTLTGSLPDVPYGQRTFTINGYDSSGNIIYSGSQTLVVGSPRISLTIDVTKVANAPSVDIRTITAPDGSTIRMAYIPAGYFTMGSDDGETNERPVHSVYLDEYLIGETEVTFSQYSRFISHQSISNDSLAVLMQSPQYFTNLDLLNAHLNYPVIETNWEGSRAYCAWLGGALASEAQWEKAARGTDARIFPWGNEFNNGMINEVGGGWMPRSPVKSNAVDVSPYGVYDMAGNVAERVLDAYSTVAYYRSDITNPVQRSGVQEGRLVWGSGIAYVTRGGAWNRALSETRTTSRYFMEPFQRQDWLGFRCATPVP